MDIGCPRTAGREKRKRGGGDERESNPWLAPPTSPGPPPRFRDLLRRAHRNDGGAIVAPAHGPPVISPTTSDFVSSFD